MFARLYARTAMASTVGRSACDLAPVDTARAHLTGSPGESSVRGLSRSSPPGEGHAPRGRLPWRREHGVRIHPASPPIAALGAALLLGCSSEPSELPPLGEVLVVVDTDAPLSLVARLRADVFTEDGTWIDSRDLSMSRAEAWPGSFGVYVGEGA